MPIRLTVESPRRANALIGPPPKRMTGRFPVLVVRLCGWRSARPQDLRAPCNGCLAAARTPRHRMYGNASWCARRRRDRGRRHVRRGLG